VGNPADPFLGDHWTLQVCRFVHGDPRRLEIVFTGLLGGRLRLTVRAKKLGNGWFESGLLGDDGDSDLSSIAKNLSTLVQETVVPNQPDVSLDMDLLTMGPSRV
jgi:hypothetical protein